MIFLDLKDTEPGLPEFDPERRCPHCGGKTESGYGMAGGGIGPYTVCDACEVVVTKSCEPE